MIRQRAVWVCAVFGTLLCLGLGQAPAQPKVAATAAGPEKLIPAGAVAYLSSDGLDAHDAAWKKTAAYEALYGSGVMALLEKVIAFIAEQGSPESTGFARAAFETLSRKGFSVAVAFPEGTQGAAIPLTVIVVHQGASLKPAASQMLKELAEGEFEFKDKTISGRTITSAAVPNSPGVEIGWWTEGTHLVLTAGTNAVNATLNVALGKSPNITTDARYKKARDVKGYELTTVGWLDVGALRTRFGDMPLPLGGPGEEPVTVARIIDAVGLQSLGTIVTQSGFQGRASRSDIHMETSGPRTGLMALSDQKPLALADLPPLPVDTNGFSAVSFDLGKAYDDIIAVARGVAKLGPPEAAEQLEMAIGQAPEQLGLDVHKEFLAPLGNVVCVYDDPLHGVFGLGFAVAIAVDDAETLKKTVDKVLGRLQEEAGQGLIVSRAKKAGRDVISLNFRDGRQVIPIGVSLAIDKKWLVVGLMPQTIEAFLLRLDGKLPAYQQSPAFADIAKQVPAKFSGLTVSDPRKTYGMLLSWAPWLLSMGQMAMQEMRGPEGRGMQLPITVADIPPAEQFIRPLFPNVSVSTVDATGIHTVSQSSLPAVPFLNLGGEGAATTAIAVALLLPAVQQAREAARRAQSKNNLKQLGLAVHNYHDSFNQFPLAARENDQLKVEKRLSWIASLLPYLDQSPLYDRLKLEEAWDADDNKMWAKTAVPTLLNPGISAPPGDFAVSHYVGIAGVGKETLTAKMHDEKTGVFGYERKTRFADITDGTSNTMMIAEAAKDFAPWARAQGSIRALTKSPYVNGPDGLGGPFVGGFHVLMGDGSVRFVSVNVNEATLEALATCRGGEVLGEF